MNNRLRILTDFAQKPCCEKNNYHQQHDHNDQKDAHTYLDLCLLNTFCPQYFTAPFS